MKQLTQIERYLLTCSSTPVKVSWCAFPGPAKPT